MADQPILNQFVFPTDVIAGFDELIYRVENGTQVVFTGFQILRDNPFNATKSG